MAGWRVGPGCDDVMVGTQGLGDDTLRRFGVKKP